MINQSNSYLSEWIKKTALESGFSVIGFTNPSVDDTALNIKNWINKGYHASMDWIKESLPLRLDPNRLLENAQTIICLGVNYFNSSSPLYNKSPSSKYISIYAVNRDYHKVIKKMLKNLWKRIKEKENTANARFFVDSGPIMEKYFAQKAGIGWYGKNSLLINKVYGPWLFLGILMTDLKLTLDEPHPNLCYHCEKCISACPNNAIVSPYIVDCNRCIAYLTNTFKEPFNSEQLQLIKGYAFGCDYCANACPYPKQQRLTQNQEFQPVELDKKNDLNSLLETNEENFYALFKGSPIYSVGIDRWKRNLKALSNSID